MRGVGSYGFVAAVGHESRVVCLVRKGVETVEVVRNFCKREMSLP